MKFIFTIVFILISIQFSFSQENKQDGPFKDYYESGELKTEGQYKNQKRDGEWKSFHKNGEVSRLYSYDKGKLNKENAYYYDTGIMSFKTEKEGTVYVTTGYYKSGKLEFKRVQVTGYYNSFYESGAKKIETKYLRNEIVGPWKKYYENGQLEWIVNYFEGYRQLEYKHYYENGDLKLEGYNFKDKVHGEEKRYLPNNVLEWKGSYENGVFVKTWTKYDAEGNKVQKIKFKNGKAKNAEFADVLKPTKVAEGVIETMAIYPGCEEALTNSSRKKCMNQGVAKFVVSNFDVDMMNSLGFSPGKKRIFVTFKINKEGKVIEVSARGPHPMLETEAIRILNKLPNVKPGTQRGKAVIMPFALPIIFMVN